MKFHFLWTKKNEKRKAKENDAKSEKDILDEKLQEELEQEFENFLVNLIQKNREETYGTNN